MSANLLGYLKFLTLLFYLFQFVNGSASPTCWSTLNTPSPTSTYFILAMGANTSDLTMANHDAQAFADAIQKHFQIPSSQVCVLKNVNFLEVKYALKRLQQLVQETDTVFIYFSGHGTTEPESQTRTDESDCQDEALVTFSRNRDKPQRILDDDFVAWVNKIKTDNINVFLDTCFASGMLRGEAHCPNGAKSKFWLNPRMTTLPRRSCQPDDQLKQLKGTLYAAAQEHQLAWEIPKRGGLFTYTLINNIKQARPNSELDALFQQTAQQIVKMTKNTACQQHPQKWSTR